MSYGRRADIHADDPPESRRGAACWAAPVMGTRGTISGGRSVTAQPLLSRREPESGGAPMRTSLGRRKGPLGRGRRDLEVRPAPGHRCDARHFPHFPAAILGSTAGAGGSRKADCVLTTHCCLLPEGLTGSWDVPRARHCELEARVPPVEPVWGGGFGDGRRQPHRASSPAWLRQPRHQDHEPSTEAAARGGLARPGPTLDDRRAWSLALRGAPPAARRAAPGRPSDSGRRGSVALPG